jgi:hypothetical protein
MERLPKRRSHLGGRSQSVLICFANSRAIRDETIQAAPEVVWENPKLGLFFFAKGGPRAHPKIESRVSENRMALDFILIGKGTLSQTNPARLCTGDIRSQWPSI